ncbi:MAG: serine/threonine-protein kinase [Thermoanaerobaculia bacterium]|nr:serine/threonine-protein kinase [Thermoanaerobaculia bacterium]
MGDPREPSTPSDLVREFGELLDLDASARGLRVEEIAKTAPEMARLLERMLTRDAVAEGPLERGRVEVVSETSRKLLSDEGSSQLGQVGSWRLKERLGEGGMGEVFLGERSQGGFDQRAAIKMVRFGLSTDGMVQRFLLERQILARLEHSAIARLLDGGLAADGRPWFAMELIEGEPITRYASRSDLSVERILDLVIAVAEAVDYAHRSLVLHRDLKPSNILITAQGLPKLLDFGLAKVLEGESDAGESRSELRGFTPSYAAPEQVLGEAVTTATDVYALGVLLYELLTGELPNPRTNNSPGALVQEVEREVTERPSQRLERTSTGGPETRRRARRLEGDLDTILLRALAREPERRYRSAAALADDLRRHLGGQPVSARPDTRSYRLSKFLRRNRVAAVATVLTLFSLVAGLTVALMQTGHAKEAALQAQHESERAVRLKDFLLSVFREASPLQRAKGEPLSVEELLDAAESRIDVELVDEPLLQADLWDDLAETRASMGDLMRAAELIDRAIATKRAQLRSDDLSIVESLTNLGAVANLQERAKESVAALDEAIAILGQRGESDSFPATAVSVNRVHALLLLHRDDEAAAEAERARALVERWTPGTPDAALQSHNAGLIAVRRGRYEEARVFFSRAVEELEAVVGPDHALLQVPLTGLADLLEKNLSDPEAALPVRERIQKIVAAQFPEDAPRRLKAEGEVVRIRTLIGASSTEDLAPPTN